MKRFKPDYCGIEKLLERTIGIRVKEYEIEYIESAPTHFYIHTSYNDEALPLSFNLVEYSIKETGYYLNSDKALAISPANDCAFLQELVKLISKDLYYEPDRDYKCFISPEGYNVSAFRIRQTNQTQEYTFFADINYTYKEEVERR